LRLTGGLARWQDDPMNLQPILSAAVDSGKIACASAFIANSEGMIASACAGVCDPASGATLEADSIFQLASMTKAVTSVAAMQLVEQLKLSLDAPIGALLPQLDKAQVITGFDDRGRPQLRPAKRAITLRHLLTHTSGLGYGFMNETMVRAQSANGEAPAPGSLASLVSPLLFDPGEQWEYGVSTDWVGLAVEAASGMDLGAWMGHHIFGPLDMTDTGFALDPAQTARRAALLGRTPDGGLMPFPIEIGGGDAAEFRSGGGGLMGTGGDYIRFLRMILNRGSLDGAQILKPETVVEMSRNQIGAIRAGAMRSIVPAFAHDFDPFPDQHTGWGLGFAINPETGPYGRSPGSLAWAGIANTFYWIDPARDIAGVVLMQFAPFGDPHALAVYGAVEEAVYAV
jgi:CubicO group peptidase (beta-lactamase class C family)